MREIKGLLVPYQTNSWSVRAPSGRCECLTSARPAGLVPATAISGQSGKCSCSLSPFGSTFTLGAFQRFFKPPSNVGRWGALLAFPAGPHLPVHSLQPGPRRGRGVGGAAPLTGDGVGQERGATVVEWAAWPRLAPVLLPNGRCAPVVWSLFRAVFLVLGKGVQACSRCVEGATGMHARVP